MNAQSVDRLIHRYGPGVITDALRPLLTEERIRRIETVLDARLSGLVAVIENLHDPHNGAAAIRSLEGIGVAELHVAETVEHFRFSSAIAIGAEKWIDVVRHRGFPACAQALHDAGYTLYATVPDADDDLEVIDVSKPAAVVFGNEHAGLTEEAAALCDRSVAIPMHGFSQSFNLSVSVAVAMHRLAARRRQALGQPGDLHDAKRAFLRARWYALGMRGVDAIVDRYVSESVSE